MKNRDLLLSAMGDLEDDFLMEANDYTKKTRHIRKRGILIAVAVAAVLAVSAGAVGYTMHQAIWE